MCKEAKSCPCCRTWFLPKAGPAGQDVTLTVDDLEFLQLTKDASAPSGDPEPGNLKPAYHLLHPDALYPIAQVMAFGAKKYNPWDWLVHPELASEHYRAAMGHLVEWYSGTTVDAESGCSHLAHAACRIMFLLALAVNSVGTDDRVKRNPAQKNLGECKGKK